jgi:hypothetical protein
MPPKGDALTIVRAGRGDLSIVALNQRQERQSQEKTPASRQEKAMILLAAPLQFFRAGALERCITARAQSGEAGPACRQGYAEK